MIFTDFAPNEAFDDVVVGHFLSGFLIHAQQADAVAGLFVDLVKPDLFALGRRWEKGDRAGHKRKLEETLPVGAWRHMQYSYATEQAQMAFRDSIRRSPAGSRCSACEVSYSGLLNKEA